MVIIVAFTLHVYTYSRKNVLVYLYIRNYMHVCFYVCMHVCFYVCMYKYIYYIIYYIYIICTTNMRLLPKVSDSIQHPRCLTKSIQEGPAKNCQENDEKKHLWNHGAK